MARLRLTINLPITHSIALPTRFSGIGDLSAIQTLRDDFQGYAHQVFMNIRFALLLPRFQHAAGGAGHHRRVSQDPLAVKGRLDEAALSLPESPSLVNKPWRGTRASAR